MTQEFIGFLEQAVTIACAESDRQFDLGNYDAAGQWNYHAELVTFLIDRFPGASTLTLEVDDKQPRRRLRIVEPCGA